MNTALVDVKRKVKCEMCKGKKYVHHPARRLCPKCGGVGWTYKKVKHAF